MNDKPVGNGPPKVAVSPDVIYSHNQTILSGIPTPTSDYSKKENYKLLLRQAFVSYTIGFLAALPFLLISIGIGFAHFDIGSTPSSDMWQGVLGGLSSLIAAVVGGVVFMKKTGLKSGFVTFILAGLGALIPYQLMSYGPLAAKAQDYGGTQQLYTLLADAVAILTFCLLIVGITKLSLTRYRMAALATLSVLIVLGAAAVTTYYSLNGDSILKAKRTKADLKGVDKLTFTLYGPSSDIWTLHYADTDRDNCHPEVLILNVDGGAYLQLYEGVNRGVIFTGGPECGTGGQDIAFRLKQVASTLKGRPVYVDTVNYKADKYGWVGTYIDNTYIAVTNNSVEDQSIQFYSDFIDQLQPLSKAKINSIQYPN